MNILVNKIIGRHAVDRADAQVLIRMAANKANKSGDNRVYLDFAGIGGCASAFWSELFDVAPSESKDGSIRSYRGIRVYLINIPQAAQYIIHMLLGTKEKTTEEVVEEVNKIVESEERFYRLEQMCFEFDEN